VDLGVITVLAGNILAKVYVLLVCQGFAGVGIAFLTRDNRRGRGDEPSLLLAWGLFGLSVLQGVMPLLYIPFQAVSVLFVVCLVLRLTWLHRWECVCLGIVGLGTSLLVAQGWSQAFAKW
jgi:hypothetical protein